MERLPSIKTLRSPDNTEGCYEVLVRRPVPRREKPLEGTKKLSCPGGAITGVALVHMSHSHESRSDLASALLLVVILVIPPVLMAIVVALKS
jgi:hypothetical protein